MTVYSGIFNSVRNSSGQGDRKYEAWWFALYFSRFIGNGVFPAPSTNLQVIAYENMNVVVKPGSGWINGYFIYSDADIVLPIATSDGVLNRIDRIVMRLDHLERKIDIVVKQGTFAGNPIAPYLQRDADCYELVLADILINAGTTQITQANVTDTRLDKELCGIVHGVVDQVDTTTLFNQYQSWINQQKIIYENDLENWTLAQQTDFLNWRGVEEQEFYDWFEEIQSILNVNVVSNLYNLINQVNAESQDRDKLNTNLINGINKNLAILQLKDEASERIQGSNLFADGMADIFGIERDESASNNVIFRRDGIIMATSTGENIVQSETSIITADYKPNNGRNNCVIVLDNGQIVIVPKPGWNSPLRIFRYNATTKSVIEANVSNLTSRWTDITAVSLGDKFAVIGLYGWANDMVYHVYNQNFTLLSSGTLTVGQSNMGNPSITSSLSASYDRDSGKLHAMVCPSFLNNGFYSTDIRYLSAEIMPNNSLVWSSPEKIVDVQNNPPISRGLPSMVIVEGEPVLAYQQLRYESSGYNGWAIYVKYRNGNEWNGGDVTNYKAGVPVNAASSYEVGAPCLIHVPDYVNKGGYLICVWHGKSASYTNTFMIRMSKSFDGGKTWSNPVDITAGTKPCITFDNNGDLHMYYILNGGQINKIVSMNGGNSWSTGVAIATSTEVGVLVDNELITNFTEPLIIYSLDGNNLKFRGSWSNYVETPQTKGTVVYTLPSTDFVGTFVQKRGNLTVNAYVNNILMNSDLEDDEYQFTKQLTTEAPVKLRLELSRSNTTNGRNDKITRILGGIS